MPYRRGRVAPLFALAPIDDIDRVTFSFATERPGPTLLAALAHA